MALLIKAHQGFQTFVPNVFFRHTHAHNKSFAKSRKVGFQTVPPSLRTLPDLQLILQKSRLLISLGLKESQLTPDLREGCRGMKYEKPRQRDRNAGRLVYRDDAGRACLQSRRLCQRIYDSVNAQLNKKPKYPLQMKPAYLCMYLPIYPSMFHKRQLSFAFLCSTPPYEATMAVSSLVFVDLAILTPLFMTRWDWNNTWLNCSFSPLSPPPLDRQTAKVASCHKFLFCWCSCEQKEIFLLENPNHLDGCVHAPGSSGGINLTASVSSTMNLRVFLSLQL